MGENCWEMRRCGREPGGAKANELGVRPAARDWRFAGVNHGRAGGRICWAVAGTYCGGQVRGSEAQKRLSCMNCDTYQRVRREEGDGFRVQV